MGIGSSLGFITPEGIGIGQGLSTAVGTPGWFAVESTGTSNDTPAFVSAVAAATAAGGGIVYVPRGGNFTLTSQLVLPSNVWLWGDGYTTTTITQATSGFHLIATANGAHDIVISGINFVGAGGVGSSSYGIFAGFAGPASNIAVRSCRFTNFSAGGLALGASVAFGAGAVTYFVIDSNHFVDNAINNAQPWGIAATNASNGTISSNQIVRTGGPRTASGSSYGIRITPSFAADNLKSISIVGNTIINTGAGGIQVLGIAGNCEGNTIVGNTIQEAWLEGVIVDSGVGTVVSGNVIRDCGRIGFLVTGSSTDTTVAGNQVIDNNRNGAFPHVRLDAATVGTNLTGNRIGRINSAVADIFAVQELAGTSNNIIVANDIRTSGGLSALSGTTINANNRT